MSRRYSPRRNGFDRFDSLREPEWKDYKLMKFEKNFYKEMPSVSKRSKDDIKRFYEDVSIVVSGSNIPKPIFTFEEAGFPDFINKAIKDNSWTKPTPIQSQGWPMALSGNNVVGIAQTGSGKTASFLLPAIVHIEAQPSLKSGDGPICLVLVPTRELAQQTEKVATELINYANIKIACCYGGANRRGQKCDLENRPHIIIATPGRLLDFLKDNSTNLRRTTYLVLDEADRMLDMGFEPDIRRILSQVRPDRQTLMWSATWPKDVQNLASEFLGNYIQVTVGSIGLHANPKIEQRIEFLLDNEKEPRLVKLLKDHRKKRTLIFAETKRKVDELFRTLDRKGISCGAMHGDKQQREREQVLEQFRAGRYYALIATDVASRGLDIDDVEYVINYDYPQRAEDYIHRIGRTARSGKSGVAYTFFNPMKDKLRNASNLIDILEEAKQKVPEELRQISRGGRLRFPVKRIESKSHSRSRSRSPNRSRKRKSKSRSRSRRRSRSPKKRSRSRRRRSNSHRRRKSSSRHNRRNKKSISRSKSRRRRRSTPKKNSKRGTSSSSKSLSRSPSRSSKHRSTSRVSKIKSIERKRSSSSHKNKKTRSSSSISMNGNKSKSVERQRSTSSHKSQIRRSSTSVSKKRNKSSERSRSISVPMENKSRSSSNVSKNVELEKPKTIAENELLENVETKDDDNEETVVTIEDYTMDDLNMDKVTKSEAVGVVTSAIKNGEPANLEQIESVKLEASPKTASYSDTGIQCELITSTMTCVCAGVQTEWTEKIKESNKRKRKMSSSAESDSSEKPKKKKSKHKKHKKESKSKKRG